LSEIAVVAHEVCDLLESRCDSLDIEVFNLGREVFVVRGGLD